MKLAREKLIDMLSKMYKIRFFEEKVDYLFSLGLVHGTMHLSIGQEAVAVGAVSALKSDDYILSTHRGHGHCIAKGADINLMMAEFLGKETGYCRGRGGSMHIADIESGNLGATGVVGGGIPISTGVGLSIKMRKTGQVILCFFGDGAANLGAFHESLNLAAIWKLPVIFLCENNMYGMSMPVKKAIAIKDIAKRADSYGFPGKVVDGNDVLAVYEFVLKAVKRARKGEGPSLIECKTYRWKGHSKSDQNLYRSKEEIRSWKKKCPIKRFKKRLISENTLKEEEIKMIENDAKEVIEKAVDFANNSPEPSVEEIFEGVYS